MDLYNLRHSIIGEKMESKFETMEDYERAIEEMKGKLEDLQDCYSYYIYERRCPIEVIDTVCEDIEKVENEYHELIDEYNAIYPEDHR